MTAIHGLARLGGNPELKYVGDDKKPVCEIRARLINGKQNKNTQEWEDQGFWVQVNVWGKCAEPAAKMFRTGDMIVIHDANMVQINWSDKDDEEKIISGMRADTNSISPYLPDLISLIYKQRKPGNTAQEIPATGSEQAQNNNAAKETA